MALTPEQRSMRASIASYASWKNTDDPVARVTPANEARFEKYCDEVDPQRKLPEAERLRRAKHAEKEHMTRLAFKSSKARAAKSKARGPAA